MATTYQWHLNLPLLLLLLLVVAAAQASSSAKRRVGGTCQTTECVSLAAEMASRMNVSADPCHDFYNYACGNFPNVVKYSPLKSASMPWLGEDIVFEDIMGLMTDKLEMNIYEMLVLDRVVSSKDADMLGLYNFTRLFYRSCQKWMRKSSEEESSDSEWSAELFRGVYGHLSETMREYSGETASIESVLAALVTAGGKGILTIDLPSSFMWDVSMQDDYNLTKTARASVTVDRINFSNERRQKLNQVVEFFANARIGTPELDFAKKTDIFSEQYANLNTALFSPSWFGENCTGNITRRKYTVSELDSLSACARPNDPFSWTLFFELLLQSPIDPDALVEMVNPEVVINFVTLFKSREISNSDGMLSDDVSFLIFDWLLSFDIFFPNELQKTWPMKGKPPLLPEAKGEGVTVCMMWTKTLLQPIVERMYQKAYHREDFVDIKQLIQLIKTVSIDSVGRQEWISPSAKKAIIKKIQSMKQSIGLDDLTASQLKNFYNATLMKFRDVQLLPGKLEKNFGSLLSLAVCAYARKNFDVMSGSSPVTMFMDINPLVVNAFNWIQKNQIIFPMAILAPPVYHPSYPDYINLGSLGYIIGHEIGHSFDNMGHTITQLGEYGHFWDNKTEENYLERTECVRNRYGNYTLYPGGPLLDSNHTLGNDIADIIGIKAATGALKILQSKRHNRPMPRLPNLQDNFSPEQMLFIQAAQGWCVKTEPHVVNLLFGEYPSHSPHHLRIRGIAENSQEFSKAFKCRSGRPMNPKKKCTFW